MKLLKNLKLLRRMLALSRSETTVRRKMPYKLALSLTNECDCKCKNCHVWKTYVTAPELKKEELSLAQIEEFFRKNGAHFFWVALTGGEPFLREDLADIVRACAAHCPDLLLLSIVTTGYATEEILKTMPQIVQIAPRLKFYVTVSIDGDEKTHEKNRRVPDAFSRSMRTVKGLEELAESRRNLKVRVETTVSRQNLDHIGDFVDSEIVKNHETCFTFAQESDRYFNQGTGIALQNSDAAKIDGVLRHVSETTRGVSLEKLVLKIYYSLSARFFQNPRHQVLPCYSGFASIFIGPYGEVRPCVMMPAAGKLQDFDFDLLKLMQAGPMRESRRAIIEDRCPNCWTPCEALQTIGQNFGLALYRSLRRK